MTGTSRLRSRVLATLLLSLCLLVGACASTPDAAEVEGTPEGARRVSDADINRAAQKATERVAGTASEREVSEETAAPRVREATFVHRAAPENVVHNSTYLDDPSINGDPDAILSVVRDAGGSGEDDEQAIGVWYDRYRDGGRWAVFNQGRDPMANGSGFEVTVFGASASTASGGQRGATAFVHRATPENIAGDSSYIEDPAIDGDPGASLSITQSWNPGGGTGTYNDHRVGVRYDSARERWAVFNRDHSKMTGAAAFNVVIGSEEQDAPPGAIPKYTDFYSEGDPETPAEFVSSGSSAGAIPAVRPFNFGRDPGGPEDRTLYLSVPELGLDQVSVFDTVSEEKLRDGTVHIPATGYPWQPGANVFIAGHRVGYTNTPSHYVFFDLDELAEGDEILLRDSNEGRYLYRVTRKTVVGPDSVEVMNPVKGKSLVTLQTCTLPDYERRLIIQGELVEKDT